MLVFLSRLPIMIISLFLGFFVYRWAKEFYGKRAGILALILYAFNTNIIAYSRYATTDIPVTAIVFISMYYLYKLITLPTKKKTVLLGILLGIALLTKLTAIILIPIYLCMYIFIYIHNKIVSNTTAKGNKIITPTLTLRFSAILTIILVGVAITWSVYFIQTMHMPTLVQQGLIRETYLSNIYSKKALINMSEVTLLKPVSQYLLGAFKNMTSQAGTGNSYLLGSYSTRGWWYYYPLVILYKTQIPIFILLFLLYLFRKDLVKLDIISNIYIWIFPLFLIIFAMASYRDIGVRHLLLIYPFILLYISNIANYRFGKFDKTRLLKITLLVALIIWYIMSCLTTYPFFLSYYNEIIGGKENGYKYLGGSNTDWGQDTKRLVSWVNDNKIQKIYFEIPLNKQQIQYYLNPTFQPWSSKNGHPKGYLAISAYNLTNSSYRNNTSINLDKYSWLKSVKPIYNIGGSIFIYDLK